ncbi:hypothetical protein [Saccharothrix syringae]|uniref:Uncharacterized protein n=1 Tax=Saccharothrix syringae TaxID=103733 RepID=A0A5Q0HCC1_SACSY|nr:hypothetical protein [Saccharothrix syringae]QFZ23302.1 hypothetical protein EKG83_42940 [Saccharothrix syringae]
MRIVGIELRRTSALLLGGLVLLVVVWLLYWGPPAKGGTAWVRQWSSMAGWIRYMLVFAWPLAVGGGALLGLRDRRSGVEELFGSTPRPRSHRLLRTLAAVAVALGGAYLVVVAVGAVQLPAATTYFHWGWLPVVLVGVLALVAGAWLGVGLGRVVPFPLTPPVAAVAALALMVPVVGPGAEERVPWTLLGPTVPSPRDLYVRVAGSVNLGQAVWFAGVALAGVLLCVARRWWSAALPVLVAGAVAVAVLPAGADGALSPDPVAAEVVCADGLCLTRVHEGERAALAGPAREALRLLGKLPSPPVEVREVAGRAPTGAETRGAEAADVLWVHLDEVFYFGFSPLAPDLVVGALVAGAGTRRCGGLPEEAGLREDTARWVMTAWVTGGFRKPSEVSQWVPEGADERAVAAWGALRAVPVAEQAVRVQAAREAQAACSGDPLAVLVGEAA